MTFSLNLPVWMRAAAAGAAMMVFAAPAFSQSRVPGVATPGLGARPISSNSNTDYANTFVPVSTGPGFAAANAYANEQAEERRKEADRIARASYQRALKDAQALTAAAAGLADAASGASLEKNEAEILARVKRIERLSHDLIQASVQR